MALFFVGSVRCPRTIPGNADKQVDATCEANAVLGKTLNYPSIWNGIIIRTVSKTVSGAVSTSSYTVSRNRIGTVRNRSRNRPRNCTYLYRNRGNLIGDLISTPL